MWTAAAGETRRSAEAGPRSNRRHGAERPQGVELRKLFCSGDTQYDGCEREASDVANEVSVAATTKPVDECEPLLHRLWVKRLRLALEYRRWMEHGLPRDLRLALIGS